MQMGPDNKPRTPSSSREVELERGALEPFTVNVADPFSRYILHYGVKAVAHAAIAHRALDAIENYPDAPTKLIETFKIRANPLSFSLGGLTASGVIVPTAAMTASSVFWADRRTSFDRVDFAHPDLLNPLLAHPSAGKRSVTPQSYFQLDWSKTDLLDRQKMGATLLIAERVWESCVGLLRSRVVNGEILLGAVENLVHYYSGYLTQLKVGGARQESLAAGEAFLAGLVRRDEEVAARVLEESRLAALAAEPPPLAGSLPRRPQEKATRRTEKLDGSMSPIEREEVSNLIRLRAIRELIHSPDAGNRAEGMALLRQWRGQFTPRVEAELNRTLKQAARLERWLTRIETGLLTFERGDTAEGIRLVREVASHSDIPLIKDEARKLLKTFGHVLTSVARSEHPSDEWPKPGARRRLVDVVQAAYTHGSDAEVICHDGLKRYGRLCFGGITPTALKLLDFYHEITWDIDLTTIQSIKFFYDENPVPPRDQSNRSSKKR